MTNDEAIRRILESRIADVETAGPGYVVSYDPAGRTADVQAATRRPVPTAEGDIVNEDREIVPAVPVMFPGGGGVRMTWKLRPGDTGLLVTLRYSAQAWRSGNGQTPADAKDLRAHHIANSVFFPGWAPDAATWLGSSIDALVIEADTEIRLGSSLAVDYVTNDTKLQIELSKLAVSVGQIATLLNTAGPVTGAPGTVTPYTPAPTALTKVKGF